jgi:hypothetical protein
MIRVYSRKGLLCRNKHRFWLVNIFMASNNNRAQQDSEVSEKYNQKSVSFLPLRDFK